MSLMSAQFWAAWLHYVRREVSMVQALAENLLTLATTQGFPLYVGYGTCWRGWALVMQGEGAVGLAQLREGMATILAVGQEAARTLCLLLLAEASGHVGQVEDGLGLLAQALTAFETSQRGDMLTEAHRYQGALRLRRTAPEVVQAEACFHQALAVARRQEAKSLELRSAMSLARL